MVRVIAGMAGGLRLRVPKGNRTRPTADRVKESLFNILGPAVIGARVLDLFAGSGALGIEALSRGAACATFIEADPRAIETIRENLCHTGFADRAHVIRAKLPRVRLRSACSPHSLIFMDPPYQEGLIPATLAWLVASDAAAPDALVIVEHSALEEIPPEPKNVRLLRQERIGDTSLTILALERRGGEPPPA